MRINLWHITLHTAGHLFCENLTSGLHMRMQLSDRRDAYTLDMLEIPQGAGAGLIWDKSGHIVTNYHVIRGASDLQVMK